jgi:hypothetical protein
MAAALGGIPPLRRGEEGEEEGEMPCLLAYLYRAYSKRFGRFSFRLLPQVSFQLIYVMNDCMNLLLRAKSPNRILFDLL